MSSAGAARPAGVPVSNARAEASRKNGAKSRGPKTAEGKARSAQNALKHGMRAQKYVVLPEEDADEFAALAAAMIAELAPVGALQTVLARRVAVAAWRLARADRLEVDLFQERAYSNASPGLALIRDGNGTRSFETLLRYRGAAMAEFWRALRTLKALQAERAAQLEHAAATNPALEEAAIHLEAPPPLGHRPQPNEPKHGARRRPDARQARLPRRAARDPLAQRPQPDEPERAAAPRLAYLAPESGATGRALHEPAAPWLPNEPERSAVPHTPAPAGNVDRPPSAEPSGSDQQVERCPAQACPGSGQPA
jgi:hypothetical protein